MSPVQGKMFRRVLGNFEPRVVAIYGLVTFISLACAAVLIRTDGNVLAGLALIVAVSIVIATYYRADAGFFIFFGMVLLFDQYLNPQPGGVPITAKVGYFLNLKQNPFLPPFSAGTMNPLEIQLVFIILAWFIAVSSRKSTRFQGVRYWFFALLFFFAILFSELRGLKAGGNLLPSLWEIRALIYFLLLYFLVPQIIQTRKQVNVLLWIFLVMVTVKAFQGALRFALLGFSFHGYLALTNHEDPLFIGDLLMLTMAFFMFGAKVKQRSAVIWLLPILLLGFYAGQRRAAYAAIIISVAVFVLMLTTEEKAKFFRKSLPVLIFLTIYTAAFWNSKSKAGAPVELIKSGFFYNKKEAGGRYWSNLGREFERYDLAATVQSSPIIGIGFGRKYLQPLNLSAVIGPWSLRDWIGHDQILWLLANMGAIGFFVFWVLIDSLLFEAGRLGRNLKDPFLRAIAFMILLAIVGQIVVSYFDLQLTYYRNMVVLGTLCGLLPTIAALDKKEGERAVAEEREGIMETADVL